MDRTPTAAAVALYVAWLVAVVLLLAGRHTPVPVLPGVEAGVVAGALVFTAVGALRLGARGVAALRERA